MSLLLATLLGLAGAALAAAGFGFADGLRLRRLARRSVIAGGEKSAARSAQRGRPAAADTSADGGRRVFAGTRHAEPPTAAPEVSLRRADSRITHGAPEESPTATPLRLRIADRTEHNEDLFTLRLVAADGSPLPDFRPGQSLRLALPGPHGGILRRAYSLAAWQSAPQHYELAIRRVEGGAGSGWLHANARPGVELVADRPSGHFVLDDRMTTANSLAAGGARRDPAEKCRLGEVVLVAGGVGITPLRAMLHRLAALRLDERPPTVLHYSARSRAELLFDAEFSALAAGWPGFTYLPRLTGEGDARLDADALLHSLHAPTHARFYFCAAPAMVETLCAALQKSGLAAAALHRESFGGALPAQPAPIDAATGFRIRFASHAFAARNAPTLLGAFEAAGVALDAECRSGECGRCRVRIEHGQTRSLLPSALPLPADHVLACCTAAASDLVLQPATAAHR